MTNEQDAGRGFNHVATIAVLISVLAAIVATAAIGLVLTEPVTIINAADTGEISPLVRGLAQVIFETMASLFGYL